ncbi:MAG TPA: electron-transfer flavoprotein:ubiquinone oxidoreductase [Longimicrobiales bacterium]
MAVANGRDLPVIPAEYQPALPLPSIIVTDPPDAEAVELDVLFVGAGPAGLAGAIELARLVKRDKEAGGTLGDVQIGVLDKAESLGENNLSGAVVNPIAFQELFPELSMEDFPLRHQVTKERVYVLPNGSLRLRVPVPFTMHNKGNYVASICEVVRWLGEKAEAEGVNLLMGFPAAALLTEGARVRGVRTEPSGLDREGKPLPGHMPATDITAQVTVLSEGTRGMLSQAYMHWQGVRSENPPTFALGVKEIWETKTPLRSIVHTLGWPMPQNVFGGSFMYPLEPNVVGVGLVVGLDYRQLDLDVHELLQRMKTHPLFRRYLQGGEMVEWGAKTIPEGGYWSLPERRSGDGLLMAGDCAGFVDVASLKGMHYAMKSGMLAARAIFEALKRKDTSAASLAAYDTLVNDSFIYRDLHRNRNMRLAFKSGLIMGGIKASFLEWTNGRFPPVHPEGDRDSDVPRRRTGKKPFVPDGKLTFSKLDAVFKSGNKTRDNIPNHLLLDRDVPFEVAELYEHLCPAGVFERHGNALRFNPPNCVDCKATDVLGPRWTPREGGRGPRYRRM